MIRAFDFTVEARHDVPLSRAHRCVQPEQGSRGRRTRVSIPRPTSCVALGATATDQVDMPPDVMPYAIGSLPPSPGSDMKVRFQVIRFHPADGVTVPRNFRGRPG